MLGFGYYTRGQCEYLIMAKRSSISHFLRNKHSVGQKAQFENGTEVTMQLPSTQKYCQCSQ